MREQYPEIPEDSDDGGDNHFNTLRWSLTPPKVNPGDGGIL